jgi:hypothetical protein
MIDQPPSFTIHAEIPVPAVPHTGTVYLDLPPSLSYWTGTDAPQAYPCTATVTLGLTYVAGVLEELDFEVHRGGAYCFYAYDHTPATTPDFFEPWPWRTGLAFTVPPWPAELPPIDVRRHVGGLASLVVLPTEDGTMLVTMTSVADPQDVDRNGVVDGADVAAYVGLMMAGDAAADFTQDGVIDSRDFFDFLARYFAE